MMQSAHHMARMSQKPGHFEIVRTDSEQPWHVRVVGSNGERVLAGEPLANRHDALEAVLMVARIFGATEPTVVESSTDHTSGMVIGGRRAAVLEFVDERGVVS